MRPRLPAKASFRFSPPIPRRGFLPRHTRRQAAQGRAGPIPRRGFLPRHTPQPPLLPSGEERGGQQPHLVSALRLRCYWPSTCGYACDTCARRRRRDGFRGLGAAVFAEIRCSAPSLPSSAAFSQRVGPGGALAGATKSNVAVVSPLSPNPSRPAGERGANSHIWFLRSG